MRKLMILSVLFCASGVMMAQEKTLYYVVSGNLRDDAAHKIYMVVSDIVPVTAREQDWERPNSLETVELSLHKQFFDWLNAYQHLITGKSNGRVSWTVNVQFTQSRDDAVSLRRKSLVPPYGGWVVVDLPSSALPSFRYESGN